MYVGQAANNAKKAEVNYYPEVSAAAGYGAINSDFECVKYEVDAELLETMGIKDGGVVDLIKVYGDSMEPFAFRSGVKDMFFVVCQSYSWL
jgi:phage repressor protein C with HTH and peptisase S24 domain